MWYSIVNVQNVKLMVATDFRHFHREWQGIIWILEQSIIVNYHRVKEESRGILGHPKRALVANEMYFMIAARQFFTKGRGQNPASTDGRVTSDPNL